MHKMQSPKIVQCTGLGTGAGAVRLPPGEYIQVVHFSPGSVRYRYGDITSPPLYVATLGAGPILMHPGTEVFVLVEQDANTTSFIHIRGSIADNNREGYNG